jgi:DNA excision repair protein ERCC-3
MGMPQPLIVQGDNTILLDVHDPDADRARTEIAPFTELEKSPEHFHTYRITPLSVWNAASAGLSADAVVTALSKHSRFPVPAHVEDNVRSLISRFGKLRLEPGTHDRELRLVVPDPDIRAELLSRPSIAKFLRRGTEDPGSANPGSTDGGGAATASGTEVSDTAAPARESADPSGFAEQSDSFFIDLVDRGTVKLELIRVGYPVDDRAPLNDGEDITFELRPETVGGKPFHLRDYQVEAARTFYGEGRPGAGYGTVVLPCGAGKTVVGMAAMDLLRTSTLILTTNVAAVHQWIDELIDKTSLTADDIGEYTGHRKDVRPVTVATYQILVWRADRESPFPHFDIFRKHQWGLIIYDEVHLLPAPIFRVTAEIQAIRRLGLTATLIREDGREEDVFTLVGPKRYDVPWKELEQKGWIAEAVCYEIRLDMPRSLRTEYAVAEKRSKFRIASENPRKVEAVVQIVENHREDAIMVIGQYLDQLHELAARLEAPIITGKTPNAQREEIYAAFRSGSLHVIVVSKVANFAIDLPDAAVAIQVSGSFGSRQEEAQRLGRILRPKKGQRRNSFFYTLVSNQTVEEQFAANRQKFLTEQGYAYHIEHWED